MRTNRITSAFADLPVLALAIAAFVGSNIAHAQRILVAETNGTNGIRSYNITGTQIKPSLVGGTGFQGLALAGSTLYISDATTGNAMIRMATLNGTGGVASTDIFTIGGAANGLDSPFGLALTANHMYIANFNTGFVVKYDLGSGLQVNSISINSSKVGPTPNPYGLAIKDDTLWVSQTTTGGASTVMGFSLTTFSSTPTITISSLNLPKGLAVAGNTLYVANGSSTAGGGTIKTFNATTGAPIATLVSGLDSPQGLTVYANKLYVTGGDGTVKGFDATTGGALPGFTTITGLSSPNGIVVIPPTLGTLTIGMMGGYPGLTLTGAVGSQYTIEYTSSLTPPIIWTTLTSGTLITSPFVYIDTNIPSPSRFYRATYQ